MGKEIQVRELVNFCEEYNSVGFGNAEIIELEHKIIVKLYNAGFSENESLDIEFKRRFETNIILDYHPIVIAEFSKLDLHYNTHVVGYENLSDWCGCCSKKESFNLSLEIS